MTAITIVNDFIEPPVPPSDAGVFDRVALRKGLPGSAFSDVLRGDNADAAEIAMVGFTRSVLTDIGLIDVLHELLGRAVASFGAGKIILGDGSDITEGRMGDDINDCNPRLACPASMDECRTGLAGTVNPSQLTIVGELLMAEGSDFDAAIFCRRRANYTTTTAANGTTVVTDNAGKKSCSRPQRSAHCPESCCDDRPHARMVSPHSRAIRLSRSRFLVTALA